MATRALVDTTVLYAAVLERTRQHDEGLAIVQGADDGDLPQLHVPDVVIVEAMNGIMRDGNHAAATEMLDRLEQSSGFHPTREPIEVWNAGNAVFRSEPRLSLADAVIVAAARHHGIEYLYGFDDDFDGFDGLKRLAEAENPYAA